MQTGGIGPTRLKGHILPAGSAVADEETQTQTDSETTGSDTREGPKRPEETATKRDRASSGIHPSETEMNRAATPPGTREETSSMAIWAPPTPSTGHKATDNIGGIARQCPAWRSRLTPTTPRRRTTRNLATKRV